MIGSIRRECLDHVIPLGERHRLRMLREYGQSYNDVRTHQSLDGNAPVPRQREQTPVREVVAKPVLGGLHHRYRRAA